MRIDMQRNSNLYKEIFSDEEMLAAFGTTRPNVSERTVYFFDCWMKWRDYRFKFEGRFDSIKKEKIKVKLKQIGLRDLWDYQLKNNEIRFKDSDTFAFFKIILGDL